MPATASLTPAAAIEGSPDLVAFLQHRFEYLYVYSYSNIELELFYKITGLWAGLDGSILFWAMLLAMFTTQILTCLLAMFAT